MLSTLSSLLLQSTIMENQDHKKRKKEASSWTINHFGWSDRESFLLHCGPVPSHLLG